MTGRQRSFLAALRRMPSYPGSVALHEDGGGVPPPVRLEPLDRLDDELAGGTRTQPVH